MIRAADSADKRTAGTSAEDIACAYLQRRGLRLLLRNYRCHRGEIDLIMRDAEYLVFVEVRYRRRDAFGSAAESISATKRERIVMTANHYLQRKSVEPPCRFDVVAVHGGNLQDIDWIRDAFQA